MQASGLYTPDEIRFVDDAVADIVSIQTAISRASQNIGRTPGTESSAQELTRLINNELAQVKKGGAVAGLYTAGLAALANRFGVLPEVGGAVGAAGGFGAALALDRYRQYVANVRSAVSDIVTDPVKLKQVMKVPREQRQGVIATLIRQTKLFVWDEAPMMSKDVYETVDRSFREIMKSIDPRLEHISFGGKLIVFSGDFRQLLPIVRHGNKTAILSMCMNQSSFWSEVKCLKLKTNMRLTQLNDFDRIEQSNFADYLLKIGDGVVPTVANNGLIDLSENMCIEYNDPKKTLLMTAMLQGHTMLTANPMWQKLVKQKVSRIDTPNRRGKLHKPQ
jgi:ATP-dependent DNA helicase PIF1